MLANLAGAGADYLGWYWCWCQLLSHLRSDRVSAHESGGVWLCAKLVGKDRQLRLQLQRRWRLCLLLRLWLLAEVR